MAMPNLDYVLLFVKNPAISAAFYSQILNLTPIEQSPSFALFALPNGIILGLWSQETARPEVVVGGGGTEICFSDDNVDVLSTSWKKLGISMALEPTAMDGMARTFVALDPDKHRIRVFKLEGANHA